MNLRTKERSSAKEVLTSVTASKDSQDDGVQEQALGLEPAVLTLLRPDTQAAPTDAADFGPAQPDATEQPNAQTDKEPFPAEDEDEGLVEDDENEDALNKAGLVVDPAINEAVSLLAGMTRAVIQRCAKWKQMLGDAQAEAVGIGKDLITIRAYLQENQVPGGFDGWLAGEFRLSRTHAYRLIDIAKVFGDCPNLGQYDQSALYLLAAPGTPQEAREEAKRLADSDEFVDYTTAALIIDKHKADADADENEQGEIEEASKGEDVSQVEDDGNDEPGEGPDKQTTEADEQEEATAADDYEACEHNIKPKSSCSFCKAQKQDAAPPQPSIITFPTRDGTSSNKPNDKAKATKPKRKPPQKHHHVFSQAGTAWVHQAEPDCIRIELCERQSKGALPSKTIWQFGLPLSMAKALHTHLGDCIELMKKKEGVSSHELQ